VSIEMRRWQWVVLRSKFNARSLVTLKVPGQPLNGVTVTDDEVAAYGWAAIENAVEGLFVTAWSELVEYDLSDDDRVPYV